MMNNMIRTANKEDHDLILGLLESVKLPTQGIRDLLDNFLVLTDGELIIGTGGLEIYGDKGLLRSLAVHPDYQNRGYGQKLYRQILEYAHEQQLAELYLLTETAEKFFAELGFKRIPREAADEHVQTSEEFRSLCPSTAACMRLKLS